MNGLDGKRETQGLKFDTIYLSPEDFTLLEPLIRNEVIGPIFNILGIEKFYSATWVGKNEFALQEKGKSIEEGIHRFIKNKDKKSLIDNLVMDLIMMNGGDRVH